MDPVQQSEHPRNYAAQQAEKQKPAASNSGDEPSLAELLLGLLAKDENEDPDAPPPRTRNREDYYAAVERKRRPDTAALPETSAE